VKQDIEISRRAVLAGTVGGVAVFTAGAQGSSAVAVPLGPDRARWLTEAERRTLRAAVDRVVPGADEDAVPGAVAARCHVAIDALLGAFTVSPPRIYAGGPFSDRGGAEDNDFAEFLPLDRYETQAWRVRIEGSRGRKRFERNGKVQGYQRTYRLGLAALEESVPGGFSQAPAPARDLAMRDDSDARIKALVDLLVTHTLEFMYGAPEYGGNRDVVGWTTTDFEGDVQPRGWTREQVESPEPSPPLDLVDDLLGGALGGAAAGLAAPLVAMGSTETLHGVRAVAGDRFSAVQDAVARLVVPTGEAAAQLAQMQELAQRLVDEAGGPR
jgi:Gluconate 2-dehydrogenase subunit 3